MAKVYLKYSFIFDPATTWNSKEQFNTDLGVYFQSKGYNAEIIKSALENPEELLVYLDKKQEQQQTFSSSSTDILLQFLKGLKKTQ